MKSLITAIILAAVIIFGGVYATNKLNDVSDYLIDICENTRNEIEDDDFEEAKELADKMKKCLEDNYNMFATSIDHNEVDKISVCQCVGWAI